MKNNLFLLTVALGLLSVPSMAQTVQFTDPSAALEVKSSTKGFLPPRLTTEERDAIVNPAMGLIVYNTSKTRLEYFDGTVWGGVGCFGSSISFIAVKTINQSVGTGNTVTWENQYNLGGGFNDLEDLFEAPVRGTYFFFVDAVSNHNDNISLGFYVNEIDTKFRIYDSDLGSYFKNAYGSAILHLNAGDKVEVGGEEDTSIIYGTDGNYSSRFGGFLLSQD